MKRSIRILNDDNTFQDLELASFNVIEKGRPSIWIGSDNKNRFHLTIGGNLIKDLTKVKSLEILRED